MTLHMSERLLEGVKVLDLSMHLAGPYGSMLLADMGADVIKVEPPFGDPLRSIEPKKAGVSVLWASVNRNKRGIIIDLQQEAGRALLLDLVREVDVVFNNFRPGVMDRLRLGFDEVRRANPKIVYGSLSGYGQTGPRRLSPAYDTAIQALAGIMSLTGHPGGEPARAGVPIADLGGGIFLAMGVLAGLVKRERTGEAVMLDISMLDTQVSLLVYWAGLALNLGQVPPPQGSGNSNVYPYGAFETSDGYVIVAVWSGTFWPKLCDALGRPDLAAEERFDTNTKRVALRNELADILRREFRKRTTAEWLDLLDQHDVPSGPVNDVAQAMDEAQVRARDMRLELDIAGEAFLFPGNPVKTMPDLGTPAVAPPGPGQDTQAVLKDLLALDESAVNALITSGVVRTGLKEAVSESQEAIPDV